MCTPMLTDPWNGTEICSSIFWLTAGKRHTANSVASSVRRVTGKQNERMRKELEELLITSVVCNTVRGETQANDLADFTVNMHISFMYSQISKSTNVLPGVFRWCTIWTETVFSLILSVVYSLNYQSSITNTNNKKKWLLPLKNWFAFSMEAAKSRDPVYVIYCSRSSPGTDEMAKPDSPSSFTDTKHLSP